MTEQSGHNQIDENADKDPIALRMAKEKPQAPFSQHFADDLYGRIHAKPQVPLPSKKQSFISNTMNKFIYGVGGVLVVVIVVAVIFLNKSLPLHGPVSDQTKDLFGKGLVVKSVGGNSFGTLSNLTFATAGRGGDNAATPEAAALENKDAAVPTAGITGGGAAVPPGVGDTKIGILPPYVPTQFVFEYKGDPIETLPAEQFVYKRLRGFNDPGITGSLLERLRLGLLDINKFQNAKLQNIAVVEDREYGYALNLSMEDGSASIYENWIRWPIYQEQMCYTTNCPPYKPIEPEEVPSDDELISMAQAFVAEYGINLDAYGDPVVEQNEWRIMYERSADKSSIYIPEIASVVFPLRVEGKDVFDEGGYRTGLHLSINIRAHRVSSVYDLTAQQYEKSAYEGETDITRVMKLAGQGGFRYYPYYDGTARKVTVELGTPTMQLMRFWRYTGNQNDELLVPALFFPIQNREKLPDYFQKFVIVPVVKSILDEADQMPQPIPLDAPMPVDVPVTNQSTPAVEPDHSMMNHPAAE